MSVNLKSLIGKLNDPTRSTLEAAAGLCLSRTHYDIEVEHYLLKLAESSDGDLARILKAFSVDKSRLTADLTRSLDKLKSGNARTPALSPSLLKMKISGNLLGSRQPRIIELPCTCITMRIARPTIRAAPVPAARQIPLLSC